MNNSSSFESMAASPNAIEQELSWDAQISEEAPEFITLPEGDYEFTVSKFERERFNGSEKVPPCNQLIVHLTVSTQQGIASIRHNFFMLQSKAGFLGSFLSCIGLKKEGEPIKLDVTKLPGCTGKARIGIRTYNDKTYNQVSRFLKPENTPNKGFQGSF